jgi:Gram-negative bacterial TonB protein C-terminal
LESTRVTAGWLRPAFRFWDAQSVYAIGESRNGFGSFEGLAVTKTNSNQRTSRQWIWRAVVASMVVSLHVLVGQFLIRDDKIRAIQQSSPPLEITFLLSPDSDQVSLLLDPPKLFVTKIHPSTPPGVAISEASLQVPSSVAITIPGPGQPRPEHPAAPPLIERIEWDSGALSHACARTFPQVASFLVGVGSVTLLALVEEDGHPSQTKVVMSSGDALRDKAVDGCVLSLGEFEPASVGGRPTASWQRIHWAHHSSMVGGQ